MAQLASWDGVWHHSLVRAWAGRTTPPEAQVGQVPGWVLDLGRLRTRVALQRTSWSGVPRGMGINKGPVPCRVKVGGAWGAVYCLWDVRLARICVCQVWPLRGKDEGSWCFQVAVW